MATRPTRRRRGRRRSGGGRSPVRTAAKRLGIDRLYPEQQLAIDAILARNDVLLILPTGFGKSACYQIPSMVLQQPVVVISPLLALLRDQQQKLETRGIACVRLDGTVRGRSRTAALAEIVAGGPLLVMTTPESLETDALRGALGESGVGLVAVDEAHCISEWGHDFRPSYLKIGATLSALGRPPVLALTATATARVRSAIVRSLRMSEPRVVAGSPHRSNLAFEVLECEGDLRLRALVRLVQRLRRPGIVYCATRREVDALHMLLKRFGVPSYRYHGGMTTAERDDQQQGYMQPRHRTVMVATSAFGLGIDKSDIRFVLHYQGPASLEQYVQEAGRAGRDGKKANCILLGDPADRSIHEALLARSRVRPDQLYRLGHALAAWGGEKRDPSLTALAVSAELGPRITAALLTPIEEAGLVQRDGKEIRIVGSHETIERDVRALAGQFETLRVQDARRLDALAEYAATDACRATFLRSYFGEESAEACGLCDVCRGRPMRSENFFTPLAAPVSKKRGKRRRGRSRAGKRRPRQT